ncbi:VWA domain-containing protein [Mesonia aestuariivivens]|uniref:VWA domain-containing protein n=1 Tax=Mesonia aestuariivivens TaxID=2796128 RepID=A0ABS6W4W4_9FLAO|nr:VWA domain-containing protein [Mesonia aestuariivivens]MBW2962764.1 VWA domain-containing protein [Mesonia aestuariivivens]
MVVNNIFFIILAAVTALVLVLLQYYFTNKNKRSKHWIFFSALRFITYFSVFLLLVNPKFTNTTYTLEKPSLALVVDNSSSIKNLGEENKVFNYLNEIHQDKELNEAFSIENYSFGSNFRANDSINFSEKQSNLHQAFSNLQQLYKNKTAPIVFISDGNQTYGQDFTYSAKQLKQPIFPVVVGDTTTYADLKIGQLNANRYAFLNNKFPVEVFVNYSGNSAISKRFEIKQGNQTLYAENISLSQQKTSAVINATLPANSVGVKTYSVSIETIENEKNTENNIKNFAVEVIDEKTNVLILSSILHPDLGAFKKSIAHNQQRSATIKMVDEEIDFGNYQLVILYQPNENFAAAYQQIKQLGLNTLTVTGTQTNYEFLGEYEEIFTKPRSNQNEDYLAIYNTNYSSFQFENIGFENFPPLKDKFGDLNFSRELNSLLFQSIAGYETQTPLIATLEDGNQRYGFIFGENTWQWRANSFLDHENFDTYDDFFGKLIQYLASNKRRERLQLDYNSFYNSGENIVFKAQYFDKNFEFDSRGKLSLTVRNKETDTAQVFPFLLLNNLYEVDLSNLDSGNYTFIFNANDEQLSKTGQFTIIDFEVEKQFSNANFVALQQLNDEVYFLNQFKQLKQNLLTAPEFKPIQKSQQEVLPLIDWVYLLVIMVFCLSSEWFLRKYYGLI